MAVGGELGLPGIKGRFIVHHHIAISKLKRCQPQIVPVRKSFRAEKWIIHQITKTKIIQRKVGADWSET